MSNKYRLEIISGRKGLNAEVWEIFPRLVPTGQSEGYVIYACTSDEPVDSIRQAFLNRWKEDGDIIDFTVLESDAPVVNPFVTPLEAEKISEYSEEYWRQQAWKGLIEGAFKSSQRQWQIPRLEVERRKKVPKTIEIDAGIKQRCIEYACQIAVYRGYSDLVNALQPIERLVEKHDHEWIEFREAFASKTLAHQYHEAADIYYYANQLEAQTGESWITSDLHSLRNTYGLDPNRVQQCAEVKYRWRSAAVSRKDEAYELTLIEAIIQ